MSFPPISTVDHFEQVEQDGVEYAVFTLKDGSTVTVPMEEWLAQMDERFGWDAADQAITNSDQTYRWWETDQNGHTTQIQWR